MKDLADAALPILVVDDSPAARAGLVEMLERAGHPTIGASTAAEARRAAAIREPGLAVLDLVLPDGDGISLLEELSATWPGLPAVVVTSYVEPRSIVEAMRRGAVEYLAKPVDPDVLVSTVRQALAHRRPAVEETVERGETVTLIGDSVPTIELRDAVARLGRTRLRGALIIGEDGAGKTRVARALHAAGPHAGRPCLFLPCNDAQAGERALFGMPGTTGGLVSAAQGGTLVLDDIDRLDASAQMRLLEWVERGTASPPLVVGLTTDPDASSPLIAWLRRTALTVSPLSDRPRDVMPLARHFLGIAAVRLNRTLTGFTTGAERMLLGHAWPGNVQELADDVRRAARLVAGGDIQPEHLGAALSTGGTPVWAASGDPRPLKEIEDAYIEHVLAVTHGNKTRAAKLLGIARETLRTRTLTREGSSERPEAVS
jgi:two-component system, NtrC family, response regulator AtoC